MVSVEGSITSNPTVDFFGYFGGALLGVCLIPQLYRTYKRKSAADVSYGWGAMYFVGLIFTLVYMILIRAWAGAIPLVVEICLSVVLFGMKGFYERKGAVKNQERLDEETTQISGECEQS